MYRAVSGAVGDCSFRGCTEDIIGAAVRLGARQMLIKHQQMHTYHGIKVASTVAGGVGVIAPAVVKKLPTRPSWQTSVAAVAEPVVQSAPVSANIFSSRAKISDHCLPWLRNSRTR